MYVLAKPTGRTAVANVPGKWLSKSSLILGGCLLMCGLQSTAWAEVIVVLDKDFQTDPPNFQINLQQTGDATASFAFGDVGGSRGLIFKGTYLTKQGVDVFEYANGILSPVVPTNADYHIYPSETDGIRSISVTMDAIVDGLPSDNAASLGSMGIGLQLWQVKNGQWEVYQISQVISNKTWQEIGWSNLTAESFIRQDSTKPDFSANAGPIVFGFFVGIGYKWISGLGQVVSTSARVDNWKVEADVGLTIFKDGFEN